jgi:hypothetical protein
MATLTSLEDRIRRLHLRAEEARTLGEAMESGGEASQLLFGVAANYDRLADYIEALDKPESERKALDTAKSERKALDTAKSERKTLDTPKSEGKALDS